MIRKGRRFKKKINEYSVIARLTWGSRYVFSANKISICAKIHTHANMRKIYFESNVFLFP